MPHVSCHKERESSCLVGGSDRERETDGNLNLERKTRREKKKEEGRWKTWRREGKMNKKESRCRRTVTNDASWLRSKDGPGRIKMGDGGKRLQRGDLVMQR